MDVEVITGQLMPYITAAAAGYGSAVLSKAEENAADATVGLGQRILRRIFGGAAGEADTEAMDDLAAAPDDEDLRTALRVRVRKALLGQPELAEEVAGMLGQAGVTVTASGERSVAAQHISGVVITGDMNR
ncbi:hypothetical protein OIE66_08965 [Nonomuraea sp. NBC_01738]|uniref:hypothetical protein n=1 Tax=Nonomuraea sp. NBC_01738 TaxID=2976003 RepID=UPI002E0D9CD0|nr:hypothetical protein OIE66_08965 [Nonomuraea sp. NBC_01738]